MQNTSGPPRYGGQNKLFKSSSWESLTCPETSYTFPMNVTHRSRTKACEPERRDVDPAAQPPDCPFYTCAEARARGNGHLTILRAKECPLFPRTEYAVVGDERWKCKFSNETFQEIASCLSLPIIVTSYKATTHQWIDWWSIWTSAKMILDLIAITSEAGKLPTRWPHWLGCEIVKYKIFKPRCCHQSLLSFYNKSWIRGMTPHKQNY